MLIYTNQLKRYNKNKNVKIVYLQRCIKIQSKRNKKRKYGRKKENDISDKTETRHISFTNSTWTIHRFPLSYFFLKY